MASGYRYAVVNDVQAVIKSVREQVRTELANFLAEQRTYLESIAPELKSVSDAMDEYLLEGGKRLRPLFAYAGFISTSESTRIADIRAMASLELLQACALIHDDLMDGSDSRRGKPSMHRRFESAHGAEKMVGDAVSFGEAAAVLLGDLALVWADHALHNSGVSTPSLIAAQKIYNEMRIELMAGQFLDVREAGEPHPSLARSLKIARFKSGKYTIERPLQFGAVLAQPQLIENPEFLTQLSKIGIPLGEAFQMRDDLLGIFGDPQETGKPAGDDLREGKRTALIALAIEGTTDAGRELLQTKLGNPDLSSNDVDALRAVIQDSGAVAEVESLISELTVQTQSAITSDVISRPAQELLTALVDSAVSRKS